MTTLKDLSHLSNHELALYIRDHWTIDSDCSLGHDYASNCMFPYDNDDMEIQ